jgi:hypothetical protein
MTERRSFPSIPASNWWDLRRRFQQAVPRQVDSDYLQSVLSVGPGHANNLMPPLRAVGLINGDNRPTDLAEAWRSDEEYAQACNQMLEIIYPSQLRDALPPPDPDRDAVERWFMRNAGVGQGAARKMGAFYRLVCEADPAGQVRAPASEERQRRRAAAGTEASTRTTRPRRTRAQAGTESGRRRQPAQATSEGPSSGNGAPEPALHIDVQVHIPADASAEQIDRIFESMARHLYGRRP